jgi:Ca2+-binding RTX toxin-like protein
LVNGGGGNDTIDASTLPAATMALTLDGGTGNDVIIGGRGADSLIGGDGNDTATGGAGKDTAFLGAGNDKFIWNPGDGSDVVDGEAGNDSLAFIGSGGDEIINIAANGSHVLVTRDVGVVSMDLNSIENVVITANGGNDSITAGNGLSALTNLTIDGGTGNDTIIGGDGNDSLIGGDGDDVITGGRGADVSRLGTGNDKFIWNQGDGSDSVDGGNGFDTLVFNGAALAENTTISASGEQAILFRDLGTITMHLNSVERIELNPLGGADNTVVNDLTGSSVKQVAIDLAAPGGGVDGQTDSVTVNGRAGDDHISVGASGTMVTVSGLSAQVTVDHADVTDLLSIKVGAGNDSIDASKLPAATMALTLDGGAGNDVIIGSAGDDTLIGGSGNDKFVFNFGATGHDVITDFQVHAGTAQGDVVALAGFSDHSFAQAIADGHIAQSGTDVAISDGTHIVATLQDIALADLHAQDFLFS